MNDIEQYIKSLLEQQGMSINENSNEAFQAFVNRQDNIENVNSIRALQETMTKNWKLIARQQEINSIQLNFPNGTVGKPYHAQFNLTDYGLTDLVSFEFTGFEESGLIYDKNSNQIEGIPLVNGDILAFFHYQLEGEAEKKHQKKVSIIINPDPKSLWRNLPSDVNDAFAKPDQCTETVELLGQQLLIASKRGRSHAHKGSFRDDDYAYASLADDWAIIALADGAGSAKYSRKGSQLACTAVKSYFKENFGIESRALLTEAINIYPENSEVKTKLLQIAAPHLSAAAKMAHQQIADYASSINTALAEFHTTLAFVLIKKVKDGYAFLTFSVGDCPIVLVDKSLKWVKPMNQLDVGEYGGGTRFITMTDIFTNDTLDVRFNFEFTAQFPHLVLMSDGIYDPKFEVEANLSKVEKWADFFNDLSGNNPENIDVLSAPAEETDLRFANWMDFWSPGNHDDRTLILMF